ncbi:hypothetical protein IFT47_19090 [Pseudomonas sp. CFBP 13711]|nr:hypothetical protein [Pseudomonas sp. CFBP 13711]
MAQAGIGKSLTTEPLRDAFGNWGCNNWQIKIDDDILLKLRRFWPVIEVPYLLAPSKTETADRDASPVHHCCQLVAFVVAIYGEGFDG